MAAPIHTCQICGRAIKLVGGYIAHHGYKRPGLGWQTASCYGARHLPYEIAADAIPPCMASIERFRATMLEAHAKWQDTPPDSLTYQRRDAYNRPSGNPIVNLRPEGFDTANVRPTYRGNDYVSLFLAAQRERITAAEYAAVDHRTLAARLAAWVAPVTA